MLISYSKRVSGTVEHKVMREVILSYSISILPYPSEYFYKMLQKRLILEYSEEKRDFVKAEKLYR